ncbi:MFS transporter [Halarcobacter sp.]|uniref:MFS transporter n=1 Tax=Halarcobacter sp. TaxID=2321133 RepID=UPI002AA8660B|nr:MFS transporter [Halarcobacter sp.]
MNYIIRNEITYKRYSGKIKFTKLTKEYKIKKSAILTLLLLSMTTMMSNVAIVTTLPRLQNYFSNVDNIEFYSRLILTLPSLVIAFLAPFMGHLIFKFGKKKSAIIALLIFAIAGSAGLYLETIEEFLISRSVFGIAVSTLMIVSTSLVGDYFKDEQRHKFMGYQSAFIAIGGIFFVFGGGFLSDINWRFPFGIYLIGLILLPMVLFFLYEVPNKIEIQTEISITLPKKLLGIYFLGFFYMLIFFVLPTQMPFLIIDHFGGTGKMTGSIIALAFLSNALGAITFSKLKKKYNFSTIYIIGLCIVAIGFTGIGLVKNIYLFYLTAPILGFGGGVMMTNITAWMLSCTTFEKRVKASGYLTGSLFLGQFFSPIVFHPLITIVGVQNFFEVVGAFLFILIIITLIYKKTRSYAD